MSKLQHSESEAPRDKAAIQLRELGPVFSGCAVVQGQTRLLNTVNSVVV